MSTYFKFGISGNQECFNLLRYKDANGKLHELRPSPLPRGAVWHRLSYLEWKACDRRISAHADHVQKMFDELREAKWK